MFGRHSKATLVLMLNEMLKLKDALFFSYHSMTYSPMFAVFIGVAGFLDAKPRYPVNDCGGLFRGLQVAARCDQLQFMQEPSKRIESRPSL